MRVSSFQCFNVAIIIPILYFYLCIPLKYFSSFFQSAVNARREGNENPNSSVVAATMKLLAIGSYGYQIVDGSQQTTKKYLNDEKAHNAINTKFFGKVNYVNDSSYEVETVINNVEHKKPMINDFFVSQYAERRMIESYYNFFPNFCDFSSFKEMEMDRDSVYLALAHNLLDDCRKAELNETLNIIQRSQRRYCSNDFSANLTSNFFPRTCCERHIKHKKRYPALLKEEFQGPEVICLCSETYWCFDNSTYEIEFGCNALNKRTLEGTGAGTLEKYRLVLDEKTNDKSTNRGFRTIQNSVCT